VTRWVINGQKIWTTQGFIADYVFILCRTDPDAPQHKGISYLLCPMDQPGVEVRPIRQVDGSAEFAEVFFTDPRCPEGTSVGGLNNGWSVAMTTLGFNQHLRHHGSSPVRDQELDHVLKLAKANGAINDPLIRGVSPSHIPRCRSCVPRCRTAARWRSGLDGQKDFGVTALGATNKIFWTEYHQEVMKLAMDILGLEGQLLLGDAGEEECPRVRSTTDRRAVQANALPSSFFFSRSETIWGGTSQIQRNIVGAACSACPRNPRSRRSDPSVRRCLPGGVTTGPRGYRLPFRPYI